MKLYKDLKILLRKKLKILQKKNLKNGISRVLQIANLKGSLMIDGGTKMG
jgi:hypothetical protein